MNRTGVDPRQELLTVVVGAVRGQQFGLLDGVLPVVAGGTVRVGRRDVLFGGRGGAARDVVVKDVKGPVDRKADDELAERLGLDGLDKLKELVRGNLAEQYEQTSRFKLKRALLDALDEGHRFDLPPRMVEAESQAIWQQVLADEAREGRSEEDKSKSETQLQDEYRKIAERRVRLGLVLAEIGRERGVQVSDPEVTNAMQQEAMNLARQYNMPPQQVYDTLRQNPNFAENRIRAPLFEQKVVDLLLGATDVTEKKVSKEIC